MFSWPNLGLLVRGMQRTHHFFASLCELNPHFVSLNSPALSWSQRFASFPTMIADIISSWVWFFQLPIFCFDRHVAPHIAWHMLLWPHSSGAGDLIRVELPFNFRWCSNLSKNMCPLCHRPLSLQICPVSIHPVLVNWIRREDFMSRRRNRFNGQLELNGSGNAMKILQVAALDVVKTWGHTKFIKTFQKWSYKVEQFIHCSVLVLKKQWVYIYIFETNQNLGGYNGLYSQRYDLGSSQPWGTLKYFGRRWVGIFTSTIQDPLSKSQKHPRATCSRCPNCRKLTFSTFSPRNAMILPDFQAFFQVFCCNLGESPPVERPLATAPSTSPGGACDARGRTWEVSPQVRLSNTSSWAARMRRCWRRRTGWVDAEHGENIWRLTNCILGHGWIFFWRCFVWLRIWNHIWFGKNSGWC